MGSKFVVETLGAVCTFRISLTKSMKIPQQIWLQGVILNTNEFLHKSYFLQMNEVFWAEHMEPNQYSSNRAAFKNGKLVLQY